MKHLLLLISFALSAFILRGQNEASIWMKYELSFTSEETYDNPLYDIDEFYAIFNAPSGRKQKINGFWDGGKTFRIRFAPDEPGRWSYQTTCSNEGDTGLHGKSGSFSCIPNESELEIYQRGEITQPKGTYHLTYHDGTPFFWSACTAWNGALKSTEEEWDTYLQHRVDHNYSVIQFVTTQWRGCDVNSQDQVAYEGTGKITLNPEFFQHLDAKVDRINTYGLIAAPVLLWALPFGAGRHLSPGYTLPLEEAVMLARYVVARYGGNQVIWILGGDGRYAFEYEQRWLEIGRRVFEDDPPGQVSQHPHGRLWIGDNHAEEAWLDIVGYQSSHSNAQGTVDWINKGPVATRWQHLPARPVINMEPNYEEIRNEIDAEDVRNASYWSLFATPISGITYGANGIWPWIREGEEILNHRKDDHVSTWRQSIDFPGSLQIGYLAEFIQQYEWWNLRPANELLVSQPGEEQYNHFISVVQSLDKELIMAYVPRGDTIMLYHLQNQDYQAQWFNPRKNNFMETSTQIVDGIITAQTPNNEDWILILQKSD